jgi:flagellin
MIQTAEGALNETQDILQRMRELATQSANGTNTNDDRKAIQDEVKQLKEEIDRIGNTTEFNTQKLLNGNLQSSGATTAVNTTTGSTVAKLTAGSMTSAQALSSDAQTVTFEKDTFNIDGHEIEVNWDTLLTQAQKDAIDQDLSSANDSTLNGIKDSLVNALNTAIDQYNASNPAGANVGQVKGYLDSSDNLVLESSTKGLDSQVTLVKDGSGAGTSVGALIISNTAGDVSGGGTPAANAGDMTYNGETVSSDTLVFEIDGKRMEATLGTLASGDDMTDAASAIETALQSAVDDYNALNPGLSSGDEGFIEAVKVTTSKDGRFQVSNESGNITFKELDGQTTVSDLGLSQAQTEASGNGGMTFQIGSNNGQTITFGISDMRSSALGVAGLDVSTAAGAQNGLQALDKAISSVSSERGKLGAVQNRLEHTINNLSTSSENLTAAESRIRDVDYALAA